MRGVTVEEKAFDADALKKSVQVIPPWQNANAVDQTTALLLFAQVADEVEPWGRNIKLRDQQLRDFIPVEPTFLSALGIVCSANASFSWTIKGPPRLAEQYQTMLANANMGEGWENFVTKLSIDLYTQDSGAFVEIIRESDSPDAPVIGLANLDAARCFHTGHPDVPVLYQDRENSFHYLKWYQVATISDMPVPAEGKPGLQYCALTRLLRAVRILRDVSIYMQEKIGGRNTRAITLVRGVTPQAIQDAVAQHQSRLDSQGLMRFSTPLMVGSVDPKTEVGFETLELAGLPDGFDLDLTMKQFINQLAMAFRRDYQDFAPLPGGNLGTSTQSEVLHEKARGKGPGEFRKLIANVVNWLVLPTDVEFEWDEQDPSAEATEAQNKNVRATARKTRIDSGELTPEVARLIALEEGDLTQEQYDMLVEQAQQQEPEATLSGDTQAQPEDLDIAVVDETQEATPPSPESTSSVPQEQGSQAPQQQGAKSTKDDTTHDDRAGGPKVEDARLATEEDLTRAIDTAFRASWARIQELADGHRAPSA